MRKNSLLVFLLTAMMVLSPALGAFAETGAVDSSAAAGEEAVEETVDNTAQQNSAADEAVIQNETEVSGDVQEQEADATAELESSQDNTVVEAEQKPVEVEQEKAPVLRAADGEECTHENTYTVTEYGDVEYISYENDNSNHRIVGEGYTVTYCEDCGEEVSRTEKHINEWGPHYYEDGICTSCGHVNTCQHNSTNTYETYDDSDKVEFIDDADDNLNHRVVGEGYEITYCVDCGIEISRIDKDIDKEESHQYEDGVCVVCGHRNNCEHPNTGIYTEYGDNVEYIDDESDNFNHRVVGEGYAVTRCEVCWAELGREDKDLDETQPHEYEDGVCTICGHVNNCTHEHPSEGIMNYDEEDVEIVEIPGNDLEHRRTGAGHLEIRCEDCGILLSSEPADIDETEYHNYDENGVCELCGHVNKCHHDGEIHTDLEYGDNMTYTSIDNIKHRATGLGDEVTYCEECGVEINRVQVQIDEEENHDYEDGICASCGHVNSCTHQSEREFYYDFDEEEEFKYEKLDEDTHKLTGYIYKIYYCPDCEEILEEEDLGQTSVIEEHGYDEDGVCACGAYKNPDFDTESWSQDESGNWYYHVSDSEVAKGWKKIGDNWYLFDKSTGAMKTGWYKENNNWYYLIPGTPESDGGYMAIGWERYNNHWYYFDDKGIMQTGWVRDRYIDEDDGTVYDDWYYFNLDGTQFYGWKQISGKWYYFEEEDQDGMMATGIWHIYKENKCKVYLFDNNGVWQESFTGWKSVKWTDDEGTSYTDWYYFKKGTAVPGWQQIGSDWYYFDEDAVMVSNDWVKDSGGWLLLDANGKITKNKWIQEDGEWQYLKADGHLAVNTWAKDSGGWYWMDADGYITRDKWIKSGSDWYYLKDNGYMAANEWAEDSNGICWMESSGKIAKNKWVKDPSDNEWYFVNASGYKVTSAWAKDSSGWYWLDEDGKILKNGWAKDSTGWCWMDASGHMAKNKWIQDEGEWYHLNANGYREENKWAKDSAGWCYLGEDGKCVRSDWVKDSTGWCWLDENGRWIVRSAWVDFEGDRYYVDARGYRVTGTQTIDGTTYTFDDDGRLIG